MVGIFYYATMVFLTFLHFSNTSCVPINYGESSSRYNYHKVNNSNFFLLMNGQIFDVRIIKLMILMVDREHSLRMIMKLFFFKLTILNLYCHEILRSILILFSNGGRKNE